MDKTFNISVRDRLAKNLSHLDYVCGNTGYMVQFDFDEEWDAYPIKTARFIESSGEHHDVAVIDNQCEFPQIMNTIRVEAGVYAGDLYTTTPAVISARRSILSTGGDRPAVPEENEYDKMMEAINADALRAENAAKGAEESAGKAEDALTGMKERYYVPNVSDDGGLTWEPNAEDMPEVPAANIKGPKGDPGETAVEVVAFSWVNGVLQCSHKYRDLQNLRESKVLIATYSGQVFLYFDQDGSTLVFASAGFENSTRIGLAKQIVLSSDESISVYTGVKPRAVNPFKLKLTGAVSAEYDGRADVTVEIPAGGDGTGLPTGGEPHQMLVTDAEGVAKWEERTHYTEIAEMDILPEQNFTVDPDLGTVLLADPLGLVAGETYTVQWNGVSYNTAAQVVSEDGVDLGIAIGNVDLVNGVGDSGEPFVMLELFEEFVEEMGGMRAQIVPLDGSTDLTVRITGKGEVVHPLNKKYFGDLRGQKVAEIDAATGACSMAFDTLWAMDDGELQNAIVLKVSENESYAAYAVTKVNIVGTLGRVIQFLVNTFNDAGSPEVTIYQWWGDMNPTNAGRFSTMQNLPILNGVIDNGEFLVVQNGRWGGMSAGDVKSLLGISKNFAYEDERTGIVLTNTQDSSSKQLFLSINSSGEPVIGDVTDGVDEYDATAKKLATEEYVQEQTATPILYMSAEYLSGMEGTITPPPYRDLGLTTAMTQDETMTALKNRAIVAGVLEGAEIGYFVPAVFVASDSVITVVVVTPDGIVQLIFNFA